MKKKKQELKNKTKVMMTVKNALEFIKERIEVDLKTAKIQNKIEIDEKNIEQVKNIINLSIDTSFFKTSQSIEDSI